ncbi:ncs-2 [Cordylochernes scorpioides]|uniref:Ncs-2 n=1 Tax=Cordylochernes scorpioides TaxID=51811 RepID=A0ABY6K4Z5_9ARAC|nr:ncs-2 [Cordylochernes scorpioides]
MLVSHSGLAIYKLLPLSVDCPSGRLNRTKFLDVYRMFFNSGNPDKFCDHVFRTFDMDSNGFIDFKEFLLAVGVTSSQSPEERLKWAFKMYDINADGKIEKREMVKIVATRGLALYEMLGPEVNDLPIDSPEDRVDMIFEKMDTNRDGSLSLDEFLYGCLEDPKLSRLLNVNPDANQR